MTSYAIALWVVARGGAAVGLASRSSDGLAGRAEHANDAVTPRSGSGCGDGSGAIWGDGTATSADHRRPTARRPGHPRRPPRRRRQGPRGSTRGAAQPSHASTEAVHGRSAVDGAEGGGRRWRGSAALPLDGPTRGLAVEDAARPGAAAPPRRGESRREGAGVDGDAAHAARRDETRRPRSWCLRGASGRAGALVDGIGPIPPPVSPWLCPGDTPAPVVVGGRSPGERRSGHATRSADPSGKHGSRPPAPQFSRCRPALTPGRIATGALAAGKRPSASRSRSRPTSSRRQVRLRPAGSALATSRRECRTPRRRSWGLVASSLWSAIAASHSPRGACAMGRDAASGWKATPPKRRGNDPRSSPSSHPPPRPWGPRHPSSCTPAPQSVGAWCRGYAPFVVSSGQPSWAERIRAPRR